MPGTANNRPGQQDALRLATEAAVRQQALLEESIRELKVINLHLAEIADVKYEQDDVEEE